MEIIEAERNHELLLTTRNLRELVVCAFPYIIPIVPRSLPSELIEGEYLFLADLCKSSLGSPYRAVAAQEDQAGIATGTLARSAQVTLPQSLWLAPQPEKKERDRKRAWQSKVVSARLEGFMDWAGVLASKSTEER